MSMSFVAALVSGFILGWTLSNLFDGNSYRKV